MKTVIAIIGMSLVSLNVSFASSISSSENGQKTDTIEIALKEESSENNVLEIEQPNSFIDYDIDLNYKSSNLAPGINVGNLPIEVIEMELSSENKEKENK